MFKSMSVMEDILQQSLSSTILLGAFLLCITLYLFFFHTGPENMEPPGPRPVPLLGNLLQLDRKSQHDRLCKLYKIYGPVFTVHFGPRKVVVLAGYKTIKQAVVNYAEVFGDKAVVPIIKDLNLTHGIAFNNGDSWKEMRRFALTMLKDFGMGKSASEEKIIEETHRLINAFRQIDGKTFNTRRLVSYAVSNVISSIVYGCGFEYDDPKFTAMIDRASEMIPIMGSFSIQLYNLFPRLFKWVPARKTLMKYGFANIKQTKEFIKHLRETLNPQMSRCIVDSFLIRQMQHKASGNMNSHYHDDNMQQTVINLFVAGTDTTATTLRYGLLLMAKYPNIQDQVQEELTRVIGSRQTRVEDRKNLPYTDAVIHETQRLVNISPIVTHSASQDSIFQGYVIKKGTPVILLLESALWDEDEWESPHTFNPAHFLDKEGNFEKRDAFLPFSHGVRVCVGESLARMELFLFFTSLLQHFRFTPPPGVSEEELDLTLQRGIVISLSPHQLCAVSRIGEKPQC